MGEPCDRRSGIPCGHEPTEVAGHLAPILRANLAWDLRGPGVNAHVSCARDQTLIHGDPLLPADAGYRGDRFRALRGHPDAWTARGCPCILRLTPGRLNLARCFESQVLGRTVRRGWLTGRCSRRGCLGARLVERSGIGEPTSRGPAVDQPKLSGRVLAGLHQRDDDHGPGGPQRRRHSQPRTFQDRRPSPTMAGFNLDNAHYPVEQTQAV